MKMKGKRLLSIAGAVLLAVLVFFIGSEAVGKYRAGTMKEVSGVRVRIKTLTIPVPESPGDFIFSGTTVSPAFAVPFGASLSGETEGVHAGTYTVVCSLEDPEHSVWPDGTTGDKEITWRILPLVVPKPELIDGKCAYSGEAEEPTYGPVSPYVVTTGQLSAVLPGDYRMGVQLRDDLDYVWEDGTTAPVFFDWQIGVCRIGSILYPSVTAAFQTDRSTEEMPVEMITNWAEEAENTDGNDWLSLNGFTLSSGGVTITNEAQLTILGYGTVSAASETASELSAVKNSGSLAIRGGTFNLSYEGDGTSTDQVEIFTSTGGETVISGGTFTGNGGEAQIAAIRSAGGSVLVSGGAFSVENTSHSYFSSGVILTGGTMEMSGGSIDVHSLSTTGMGYDAEGGTLVITGGETVINGEQDCYTVLITANGDASVTVAGGTHSIEGKGGMNGFMAGDASEIRFTDGTIHMHPVNPEPGATSNGIYLAGGTMEMSGGSLTLESELISGGTLVGTAAGSLSITGGEMHLSSITPIQYGMNVPYGTVSVQGLTMTVSVPGGTAGGFTATYHEGTLTLISGDFTISGDVATPGRGYTAAHPIENWPASADCAFSLYYRSGWSSGENFRYAPYIRETVEMRGMMASAKDGRLGEFVSSGKMHLFLDTELAAVIPVKAGIWEVNVPGEGSVLAEIRTAGAEGNIEADPILIGSASQLFISGDESFDPGFRSKKPVLLRKLVKTGRRKGFPGVALTLPETESRTYGCALPAEAETPLVLQYTLNEAGEAVLIRVGRTEAVHESETESQNASETMDEPEKIPEETGQKEGGESV